MGTWAAGNFDSDGALDYVGDLMQQLVKTINNCFDGDSDLDEGGESTLMPSVAIIRVISENCGGAPPEPSVIAEWKRKYLDIYDAQIDGLEPQDEYKSERRAVIEETFDGLLKLSAEFWVR